LEKEQQNLLQAKRRIELLKAKIAEATAKKELQENNQVKIKNQRDVDIEFAIQPFVKFYPLFGSLLGIFICIFITKPFKTDFFLDITIKLFRSIDTKSKPNFLYNNDGSLREFGVGYKNKTILPLWLVAILLSMLCYLGVLYYLTYF
jgi:hypothetical protein